MLTYNHLNDTYNLFLTGVIGEDVELESILNNYKGKLDQQKNLNVWLNSPGGYVYAGKEFREFLLNWKGKTATYVGANASSIASIIALSTDELNLGLTSLMVFHSAYLGFSGYLDQAEAEAILQKITLINQENAAIYASKSEQPREFYLSEFRASKDCCYNSQSLLSLGFKLNEMDDRELRKQYLAAGADNFINELNSKALFNKYELDASNTEKYYLYKNKAEEIQAMSKKATPVENTETKAPEQDAIKAEVKTTAPVNNEVETVETKTTETEHKTEETELQNKNSAERVAEIKNITNFLDGYKSTLNLNKKDVLEKAISEDLTLDQVKDMLLNEFNKQLTAAPAERFYTANNSQIANFKGSEYDKKEFVRGLFKFLENKTSEIKDVNLRNQLGRSTLSETIQACTGKISPKCVKGYEDKYNLEVMNYVTQNIGALLEELVIISLEDGFYPDFKQLFNVITPHTTSNFGKQKIAIYVQTDVLPLEVDEFGEYVQGSSGVRTVDIEVKKYGIRFMLSQDFLISDKLNLLSNIINNYIKNCMRKAAMVIAEPIFKAVSATSPKVSTPDSKFTSSNKLYLADNSLFEEVQRVYKGVKKDGQNYYPEPAYVLCSKSVEDKIRRQLSSLVLPDQPNSGLTNPFYNYVEVLAYPDFGLVAERFFKVNSHEEDLIFLTPGVVHFIRMFGGELPAIKQVADKYDNVEYLFTQYMGAEVFDPQEIVHVKKEIYDFKKATK